MAIEGLGRLYNFVPIAASTLISVKDAAGVEFCVTGNDTFTLSTATTYNGSTTNAAVITDYYTNTSTSGGAQWVFKQQVAAASLTITSGSALFFIDAATLPASATYVQLAPASAGLVYAIVVNLLVGRAPANLRTLSGSAS